MGADYRGFKTKEKVKKILEELKFNFEDLGCFDEKPNDFPIITKKVCKKILESKTSFGILICGSGVGVTIASNKIKGIRAVLGVNKDLARHSRLEDDCNVLCLQGENFNKGEYKEIIKTFFGTKFESLKRRKRRILELEKNK